jgi:hypothetical protein
VKVVAADGEQLEAALDAAARRYELVTADGRQLDDHGALERLLDHGGDLDPRNYTPNSVTATNSTVYCDCKDGAMPLMARTMIGILVAELDAAGLRGAEVRPRPASEFDR